MQLQQRGFHILQKVSMSLMGVLVLLTFMGANLHALFWQSSEWLVSTVLPAVVVDLTNEERAENDAAPLRRNSTLDEAAQLKAEHMAQNQYFAHYSPDGVSPWHWFSEAGYVYAHAGENLAIHFTDSAEVVEAWMNSPAHRQNIVDGKFTEIGVGTAKGTYEGYNTVYVVQLFGAPAVPVPAPAPAPTTIAAATAPLPVIEAESAEAPVLTSTAIPEQSVELAAAPAPVLADLVSPAEVPTTIEDDIPTVSPAPATQDWALVTAPKFSDVVVIESPIIATSSGLAVAQVTVPNQGHAGATVSSIATQPNKLLQIVYMGLGTLVLLLLVLSILLEARRLHFVQVAYGFLLIFGMGGLWYVHNLLTTGAVVV